jgi:ubiquinone/menaquinone biosynthesis C-methylase UbiE
MKKYILTTLTLLNTCAFLNAMEQQITQREAREWDAQAYAHGNQIQEASALQFLKESGIDLKDQKVLDVGCGTGNITAKIAKTAKEVHGFDASNNMIEYAHKTFGHIPNLSFEHASAETFTTTKKYAKTVTTTKKYNVAFCTFCLHWIENKQKALESISNALEIGGTFFGTAQSTSDPEPLHFTVFQEMIAENATVYPALQNMDLTQIMDYFIISDDLFQQLLQQSGFEIISYEHKSFGITMSKEKIEYAIRPVIMSRPGMNLIPEKEKEQFFQGYIKKLITKATPQEDGNYHVPDGLCSTVFLARKIADVASALDTTAKL